MKEKSWSGRKALRQRLDWQIARETHEDGPSAGLPDRRPLAPADIEKIMFAVHRQDDGAVPLLDLVQLVGVAF